MKLSMQAIDRPRVVYIATLLVVACATIAIFKIPVQRTPAITKAVILVAVPYPGAQPTEVEQDITRKIEEKLQGLSNVDFIASMSMRGSSITQVIFLDGVDPDLARGEVKDLVDQVKRELPVAREVQPVVTDIDFENTPLMLVTLNGPEHFDEAALKQIAEEVQEELEGIQGVSNTQVFGGREREIHVNVNPDVLAQNDLTIAEIGQVLSAFHATSPGGATNTQTFDFQVRNETRLRSVQDIEEIIIRQEEGRVIRIADVAEVEDTYRRLINIAQLDGLPCASVIVNKEAGVNSLRAAQQVKATVEQLKGVYPHITFSTTRDTSAEIAVMFQVLGSSLVFGAMLVLIILGWAMGLRISLLVLLAIPLSSAVGLVFLFAAGIPLSNMVIFSFILVLGMVVDGAIIVAENIHRHIERGEDPVTAAKTGIEEVGMPVIIADATTIAAFLPMLLVPGIMGDFMGVMPKVVSVALFGSILVDHFLIPVLASQWYGQRHVGEDEHHHFHRLARGEAQAPTASDDPPPATSAAEVRIRPGAGWLTRGYAGVLRWSLDNSWAIVASAFLAIVWAALMLRQVGFDFFPASDRGQFQVKIEMPLGTSIDVTQQAAKAMTEPLLTMKKSEAGEIVNVVSAIGSSEGLASRLETDPAVGPEFGTLMVQMLSPLERTRDRHEDVIIAELRPQFDAVARNYPGMKYTIEEVEEGPPGGYDVAVRLSGDDLEQLGVVAEQVARQIGDVPGTVGQGTDFRDENPEIVVDPNAWAVGLFDTNYAAIADSVQSIINGNTTIQLSIDDDDVTLRIQALPEYQQTKTDIARAMVIAPSGRRATIGELATLYHDTGLYAVNRYKRKRAVVAKCNVAGETSSDDVFEVLRGEALPAMGFRPILTADASTIGQVMFWLRQRMGWKNEANAVSFLGKPGTPVEGVRAEFTGENEERDKNFNFLLQSMILAVILIFGILVGQFNSFRQAIVVLSAVPLSFIGVVAGMWLCRSPFSLASFIGLVALTGIVVNDAIVVVDFINQARARGLEVREAVIEAGVNRLRPVLLTTATTIGGLLPLFGNWSGGAEFWQPLTGAVIFGLAFATVLTLLVVPVGYQLSYWLLPGGRDV